MKKIISLLLAFLMLMSVQPITHAATSEGASINGWNGWSVADGDAITTKANPLDGDIDRGDMVKITDGTASRYFAQWFTGVIELSVDVYGTGTLNFHDANNRSAGLVTLADGLINAVECGYDADAWNTVKLFVMTGTNKAEVYLGDEYVAPIEVSALVRPTTLTVSTSGIIYVDNIKVSELNKTNAWKDSELTSVYESNFESGNDGWAVRSDDGGSAAVSVDNEKFGYNVLKFDKVALESGTLRPSLYRGLNDVGNIVFETELYLASGSTGDSSLTLYVRNTNPVAGNTAGGREIELLTLYGGYAEIGYDKVSSKQFIAEPLYSEDEWFKIKVEVVTENQSVIVYVGNGDGTWTRVNDVPVRIYHSEAVSQNAESYQTFERIGLKYTASRTSVASWYMKNSKIRENVTGKTTLTILEENFDDADTDFVYTEGVLSSGTYSGKQLESNVTGGERSGVGKLYFNYHSSAWKHVTEDTELAVTSLSNSMDGDVESSKITSQHYYTLNFDDSVDLTNVAGIDITYDYYDAAISRRNKSPYAAQDYLTVSLVKNDGTAVCNPHSLQQTNIIITRPSDSNKMTAGKTQRKWTKAFDKRAAYEYMSLGTTGNTGWNTRVSANVGETSENDTGYADNTLTQDILSTATGIKFSTSSNIGGLYYIDNLKVVAHYVMGDGYTRSCYSAYNTLEDNITRGELTDLALKYVEFEDAQGNKGGEATDGGKVSSITIERNIALAEGTKLLVGVYDGDILSGAAVIEANEAEYTYTIEKKLATTASSVVKVFVWDMDVITPLIPAEEIDKEKRTRLVLFGDSIVCKYDEAKSNTRGWGQLLGNHVDTNELEILNYAVSGMASSHYLNMGEGEIFENRNKLYNEAIGALREGDYAMISLATNDSKEEYGLASGGAFVEDYQTAKSFAANLYKMVRDIKEKGATPILVTTHPRCNYINKVNRFLVQGGAYQKMINDMRRLADEKDIALIDLYEMAIDEYDKGELVQYVNGSDTYYVNQGVFENYVAFTNNSNDFTHLNAQGADFAASLVAKGMAQLNCGIEKFVK